MSTSTSNATGGDGGDNNNTAMSLKCVDYLVVGGGATGMAFVDSFLLNSSSDASSTTTTTTKPSIIMIDQHDQPGGQWNDSYPFVQLHQPSSSYGVESTRMEPTTGDTTHRATRTEIVQYYQQLIEEWTSKYNFQFIGGYTVDLNGIEESINSENSGNDCTTTTYNVMSAKGAGTSTNQLLPFKIQVRKRLVDARWMQPDLPVTVPPRFDFDDTKITCVPINALVNSSSDEASSSSSRYYVVIGAGKTGMDGVYYLLTKRNVNPKHIVWIMPHDPWITARENIGNCMEFLHDTTTMTTDGANNNLNLQTTFLQWEKDGKVYRLCDQDILPTKFKDATLSKDELDVLKQIPTTNMIRGKGRVSSIQNDGSLMMDDGTVITLPFDGDGSDTTMTTATTYVHCSAGAFNYTKQIGEQPTPVFDKQRITIQDVYGTPGFCFVGSIIGRLESITSLTDEQRNNMCLAPDPTQAPSSKLGFMTGDVGSCLTKDHGYIQRLKNLKQWLTVPDVRNWLVGHRLFNLGHYQTAEDIDRLVNETWIVLEQKRLV